MSKIVVVTPTYNEADNIEEFTRRLFAVDSTLHLIVVDDNSPDGTGNILDDLAKKYSLEVIHRPAKKGYGTACLAGIKAALQQKPDRIIQMDADLSHDPRVIPRMLKQDADLVIGSRYVSGGQIKKWEPWRRALSLGANLYASTILGLRVRDVTSGYRCWKPDSLKQVAKRNLDSIGYLFLPETAFFAFKLERTVQEVPITFTQRSSGKSKLSWAVFFESLFKLLRIRLTDSD